MQLFQDGGILGVLIDSYKLAEMLALQAWKQVLADEAGGPGDDNFSR
jgi:hypothetical protein